MLESFDTIGRIQQTDKIDRIIRELEHTIVDGRLLPGTELPAERVLAERLGVSRFSLREALRAAQARGLIEIQRGRRPRVARPSASAAAEVIGLAIRRSRKALLDLVVARQALETQIARIAARNASPEHLREMAATIAAIESHPGDAELCLQEDLRFHEALVQASGNEVFAIMLAPLTELLRESRKETIREGVERVISGHRAILDAVRAGDSDAAARAMHRHLQMAEEDLKKIERGRP
ncbi:MAG: FadR family transcriptional regulator [Spirochaetales bacterium]|nr:FadR family transcriptional regulator [Spirochaetales bacterium]